MSMAELVVANVDLERMVVEENVHMGELRLALGLPLTVRCEAETIEAAMEQYNASSAGSEEEAAAFLRWRELFAARMAEAVDIAGIKAIIEDVPEDTPEEEAAYQKWLGFCQTTEDFREFCDDGYCPSGIMDMALRMWADRFFPDTTTLWEICRHLNCGERLTEAILLQLIKVAATLDEIREVRSEGGSAAVRTACLRKLASFYTREVAV